MGILEDILGFGRDTMDSFARIFSFLDNPIAYAIWTGIGLYLMMMFGKSMVYHQKHPEDYHTISFERKFIYGTVFFSAWLIYGIVNLLRFF